MSCTRYALAWSRRNCVDESVVVHKLVTFMLRAQGNVVSCAAVLNSMLCLFTTGFQRLAECYVHVTCLTSAACLSHDKTWHFLYKKCTVCRLTCTVFRLLFPERPLLSGVGAGTAPAPQQEPLQSAPSSWRDLASSSNPFANPFASPTPDFNPSSGPTDYTASTAAVQQQPQQLPQPSFDQWNAMGQRPAAQQAQHAGQAAQQQAPGAAAMSQPGQVQGYPQQQQGIPPAGQGGAGGVDQSWQSFSSPSDSTAQQAQQAQQPPQHQGTASSDAWGTFDTPLGAGQSAVAPRVAVVDSWASFEAPSMSEQQDSRVAYPSIHSQDSWSAFDNLAASRAPTSSNAPQQAQHAKQAGRQAVGGQAGRDESVTELSVENLGLDPSLQITAMPTAETPRSQRTGDSIAASHCRVCCNCYRLPALLGLQLA